VTSALAPGTAQPAPTGGAWPANTVFVTVDTPVLQQLVSNLVADRSFTGHWSATYRVLFVSITVQADYAVRVSDVSLDLVPGGNGELTGTAKLDVDVQLYAKNLASFSAHAVAKPRVRVRASIQPDNQVVVKLEAVENIHLDFAFSNVPPVFNTLLTAIVNALGPEITALVASAIPSLPAQPVTKVPAVPLPLQDGQLILTMADLKLQTLSTPDAKTMLAVTGRADAVFKEAANEHSVLSLATVV